MPKTLEGKAPAHATHIASNMLDAPAGNERVVVHQFRRASSAVGLGRGPRDVRRLLGSGGEARGRGMGWLSLLLCVRVHSRVAVRTDIFEAAFRVAIDDTMHAAVRLGQWTISASCTAGVAASTCAACVPRDIVP